MPSRSGRSGRPGDRAAGGVGGEAAGGPDPARGLAGYLLHPRPDAWAKALIAPACFLLAASSAGHFARWPRFLVLWLVLELLIYAARYQWNDIRGIEGDRLHPEARARSRLPAGPTERDRRRSIRISGATAAARIGAALLVGAAAGLASQVVVLAGAVFVVAAAYEFLRGRPAPRSPASAQVRAVAVWLLVGLGYLVRGGLGLSLGGLAWGSLAMVAGLACVASFGIMFVLLTWVLEATSYCEADADGRWHARAALAGKPHLAALLPSLGRPVLTGRAALDPGRYCGAERVLRHGGRLTAPWNLALLAAAACGAAEALALARPGAGGAAGYLAAAGVSVAAAVLLARCDSAPGRWGITAATAATLIAAAALSRCALPLLAGAPWLVIAGIYVAFRGWSYRDLVAAGPRLAAALRTAGRSR